MVINYYGASCFKVQSGDIILVFDPPSKKSDFKAPRFQANIVFVSQDHQDHNGFDNIGSREKEGSPFLINGPGEYEIQGVVINAFRATSKKNIYLLNLENINVCHLGVVGNKELNDETLEFLAGIDVLFAPADSNIVEIINQIEPKVIIPMYTDKKKLTRFLEEMGQEKALVVDKFTFKKKDISEKKEEVLVLKPLIN